MNNISQTISIVGVKSPDDSYRDATKREVDGVGETGASCYNFQLKSRFVKSMLDALFLST